MKDYILNGSEALGIELGSTRIKAVLIADDCTVLASGGFNWENEFKNGYWTYNLKEVWHGIQSAYAELNDVALKKFGSRIKTLSSIGFSAMMHGYLPFDKNGISFLNSEHGATPPRPRLRKSLQSFLILIFRKGGVLLIFIRRCSTAKAMLPILII